MVGRTMVAEHDIVARIVSHIHADLIGSNITEKNDGLPLTKDNSAWLGVGKMGVEDELRLVVVVPHATANLGQVELPGVLVVLGHCNHCLGCALGSFVL